jgi:2-hydroxymuconate-semialdehyde hydrolase
MGNAHVTDYCCRYQQVHRGRRSRNRLHERGHGPAVLLVHGSDPGKTLYSNWRMTMPMLAERYRVLVATQRFLGSANYCRTLWVKLVLDFLDAVADRAQAEE